MNRTIRILSLALAGVLLVGSTGCNRDVAAIVNGETIKKSSIDTQLAQLKTTYPQLFTGADSKSREADFYKRLLDQEINQVLVKQEAEKQNIVVTDAQVQKAIDALKQGFPNDAAFQTALKTNNTTLDKLKVQEKIQLQTQALVEKLTKNDTVTDAEMKAYYDKNKASVFADKAGIHVAHILFAEKDKATALKVLADIKAAPNTFAALAKKYSKDTVSVAKGGDLGWPTGAYPPEFQKAIDQAPAGQLIPNLVHTSSGWHIIKVIEKRGESVKPFSAVKDQVRQAVLQQKQGDAYQKLLAQLKKAAKIEYPQGQPAASVPTTATP